MAHDNAVGVLLILALKQHKVFRQHRTRPRRDERGAIQQSVFAPDLVREALAGDPNGELREAAKVVNFEKVLDSGPAPAVAIPSHSQISHSSADLVTVRAQIPDKGKSVGRIEWRVNGVTAAVASSQ